MSEMKRVAFSTLTTDLSSVRRSSTGNFAAAALFQDDDEAMPPPPAATNTGPSSSSAAAVTSQNNVPKTFRLNLELFDPNADSFPEFYYAKLVHAEKKKMKKQSRSNGFVDSFDDNDDDVARIAKEFEKKYSGSCAGKGRRNKKDDYYDKGAGYDESDSFIDNTEAYDEIIPEEIETVGGGFYINCGALEFTHLAEEDKIKAGKSRKRALSTSSSSDDDEKTKANQKKADNVEDCVVRTDGNASPKETASNIAASTAQAEKKVRIVDAVDSTVNIAATHKDKKVEKMKIKDVDSGTCSDSGTEKEKEKDKDKVVKTTTVKDMLKAKRDNYRKMQQEEDAVKGGQMVNGGEKESDSDDSSGSSTETDVETEPPDKKRRKSIEGDVAEKMRTSDVKLPDDLPADVVKDIESFKTVARTSNQSVGKLCNFTDQLTEILLRIDDACSCIEKGRALVYGHLEYQLSLEKYYLLRKVRSLRIQEENNKTKRAFLKLKKAVSEIMPSIVMSYEVEYRKMDELRTYALQFADSKKLPKYPKKKFIWNDSIRNLLFDLYQVRWTSYVVLRTRKDNLNDFIANYLKEKVVPIWPQGWMKYEELKKELEKRKKPKDNEKSEDDEMSKSQRKVDLDKMPSILSNNSNVSIISTKDLVVTISTKSDKKTEVPLPSGDTLTVIPISADTSNNRPGAVSKAADGGIHQKTSKSSSSSISSASLSITPVQGARSGSPSIVNPTSSGHGKSGHASQTNHNSSSSKHSSDSKSNSSVSSSSSSGSHSGQVASKKQQSVSSTSEQTSPMKRSTDHSINSIMSSPQSIASSTHHSNDGSNNVSTVGAAPVAAPQATSTKSSGSSVGSTSNSTSTSDTAITHVITVDNLQNTSDIISTSNKLISNSSSANATTSSISSSTPTTNGTIRVRNVSSVNSSLEKDIERRKEKPGGGSETIRPSSRDSSTTLEEFNVDTESDSDGVEIVGVFPASNKKKQKHLPPSSSTVPPAAPQSVAPVSLLRPSGKHKEIRSSKSSSRSASPNIVGNSTVVQNIKKEHSSSGSGKTSTVNSRYNDLEHSKKEAKASATEELATSEACTTAESELDVLQIMQALKELEAMQSNIHISNRKSPTNNRPGGGSHASPINYI